MVDTLQSNKPTKKDTSKQWADEAETSIMSFVINMIFLFNTHQTIPPPQGLHQT